MLISHVRELITNIKWDTNINLHVILVTTIKAKNINTTLYFQQSKPVFILKVPSKTQFNQVKEHPRTQTGKKWYNARIKGKGGKKKKKKGKKNIMIAMLWGAEITVQKFLKKRISYSHYMGGPKWLFEVFINRWNNEGNLDTGNVAGRSEMLWFLTQRPGPSGPPSSWA